MSTKAAALRLCAIGAGTVILLSWAAQAAVRGGPDFDGDGFEDLVVNVPYEDLGGLTDAGVVHVIYGSGSGPTANGDQLWHQDVEGVNDGTGDNEIFGISLAWGDFDEDGFDDLAIGVSGEDVSGVNGAGGVAVLYGSSQGLRSNGDQFFTQDSSGMNNQSDTTDSFGASLAAGDFDGDGFDDLAIGVPNEDVGGENNAGAVHVIYGKNNGLSSSGDQVYSQESDGVPGAAESGDVLGRVLAAGDFDGDGRDDLAIGVLGEDINSPALISNCGFVNVLYGTNGGLSGSGAELIGQNDFGTDLAGASDQFGATLAAGDFDGNGKDDLAIGAKFDDTGQPDAGEVDVVYGSSGGLNLNNTERWALDGGAGINDVPGAAASGDTFGTGMAAGDFDEDGRDDLAIGVPRRTIGGEVFAGEIIVVYGGSNGLREGTAEVFHQDKSGMNGSAETNDLFGFGSTAGDYDGDGRDDLGVGVTGQVVDGDANAGAVHVIFGASGGLTTSGDKVFTQETAGIRESAQANDFFGWLNGPF